nr:neutrophil defensin 6-like [Dasypus novemcinctus]
MRTLTVLSAVLLLAFLTHAEHFGESGEEQPEAQDHNMAISFLGDERATREAAVPQRKMGCSCRFLRCQSRERRGVRCLGVPFHVWCCR